MTARSSVSKIADMGSKASSKKLASLLGEANFNWDEEDEPVKRGSEWFDCNIEADYAKDKNNTGKILMFSVQVGIFLSPKCLWNPKTQSGRFLFEISDFGRC